MLTADYNVSYWGWVSDTCTKWDTRIKVLIAITASGTVASWGFWAQFPAGWKILSAVSAVAAIAHPYFFSSEKLKRISALVGTWKELCINYELLWEKDDSLSSTESWSQFEAAKRREANIDETNLPNWKRLKEKAYQHVVRKRSH